MFRSGFLSTVACAALALGCGAAPVRVDTSERVVQAHANDRRLSYRYGPVPADWERVEIPGNDAAWHDPGSNGVVHVDHSCERSQDAPLASLVQHLLIGFTEREYVTEETIPFDGREARHVVVRARLDGVPMNIELYVMKKDGCVFDLGYVARPERFEQAQPAFRAFVAGFHTLSTGSAAAAAQGGGP
jgi:hypothetical protein